MKVTLDRKQVLFLYGSLLEAERSVDFALGLGWAELRDYYVAEKRQTLRQLIDVLCRATQSHGPMLVLPDRAAFARLTSPFADFMCQVLGGWIQRWRCSWSFSPDALIPMAACLQVFLSYLDRDNKPVLEDLVALRICLCEARSFIEIRCHGLPELRRARMLKHFGQADWISATRLTDLEAPVVAAQAPSSLETR
jgi:hypothetical protein